MALFRFALMTCILSEKQGIAHGAWNKAAKRFDLKRGGIHVFNALRFALSALRCLSRC